MKRVFMIDVLACPRCGSSMSIISVLKDPDVVEAFLVCLGISPTPIVPAQSRAPPYVVSWQGRLAMTITGLEEPDIVVVRRDEAKDRFEVLGCSRSRKTRWETAITTCLTDS